MIHSSFLKHLLTILSIGAVFSSSGAFGSSPEVEESSDEKGIVINRVSEETVLGDTKIHRFRISQDRADPRRTVIFIEDYTGQKVTLEGDDLSFTEERKGPENVKSISIAGNSEGLVEVSLVGDSENEISRFFYLSGRKIRIHVGPSGGLQRAVQIESAVSKISESHESETVWAEVSDSRVEFGNNEDEVRSQYRPYKRYWWVLAHKFQTVSISGTIRMGNFVVPTYPTIAISGVDLTREGQAGEFFPAFVVAKIDEESGLPKVEIFKSKDASEPMLTVVDHVPVSQQENQ
ncbi:MAG: hypothetical protein K2L24_02145 [Opitutales bacterium]|nr:hypothetical protein [Opitutales bacterium]